MHHDYNLPQNPKLLYWLTSFSDFANVIVFIAGVQWDSQEAVILADRVIKCKNVTLKGIYTHDGHSYNSKGELDIKESSKATFGKLLQLAKR